MGGPRDRRLRVRSRLLEQHGQRDPRGPGLFRHAAVQLVRVVPKLRLVRGVLAAGQLQRPPDRGHLRHVRELVLVPRLHGRGRGAELRRRGRSLHVLRVLSSQLLRGHRQPLLPLVHPVSRRGLHGHPRPLHPPGRPLGAPGAGGLQGAARVHLDPEWRGRRRGVLRHGDRLLGPAFHGCHDVQ